MDTDYKALDMMKMQRVRGLLYIPAVNYSALGVLDKLQKKIGSYELSDCLHGSRYRIKV